MNLSESRSAYYDCSKTASELNRKLAFAGIAAVWVFRTPSGPQNLGISGGLLLAGSLFVLSLGSDLLHYSVSAVVWGTYTRAKERSGVTQDASFVAPRWINWPGIALFGLKLALSLAAYATLAIELLSRQR